MTERNSGLFEPASGRPGRFRLPSRTMTGGSAVPPPDAPNLEPGTIVGHFRIDRYIGGGGLAEVYGAADLHTKREVAIKILKQQWCLGPEFVLRTQREGIVLAGLEHRNIVKCWEAGQLEAGPGVPHARPWLAIELLFGSTLYEELKESGRLWPHDAISLGRQLAQALDLAHSRDIIHRDITPANLFIDKRRRKPSDLRLVEQWRLVVIDFGLSKVGGVESITDPNGAPGTVAYMAPEQFRRGPVDARTDVYAVGMCLYEAITGEHPFERRCSGVQSEETMAKYHLEESPPSLIHVFEGCPPSLSNLLDRCLSKDPKGRYQSMRALAADLHQEAEIAKVQYPRERFSDKSEVFEFWRREANTTERYAAVEQVTSTDPDLLSVAPMRDPDVTRLDGVAAIDRAAVSRKARDETVFVAGVARSAPVRGAGDKTVEIAAPTLERLKRASLPPRLDLAPTPIVTATVHRMAFEPKVILGDDDRSPMVDGPEVPSTARALSIETTLPVDDNDTERDVPALSRGDRPMRVKFVRAALVAVSVAAVLAFFLGRAGTFGAWLGRSSGVEASPETHASTPLPKIQQPLEPMPQMAAPSDNPEPGTPPPVIASAPVTTVSSIPQPRRVVAKPRVIAPVSPLLLEPTSPKTKRSNKPSEAGNPLAGVSHGLDDDTDVLFHFIAPASSGAHAPATANGGAK